jgi:hypothetical protein
MKITYSTIPHHPLADASYGIVTTSHRHRAANIRGRKKKKESSAGWWEGKRGGAAENGGVG